MGAVDQFLTGDLGEGADAATTPAPGADQAAAPAPDGAPPAQPADGGSMLPGFGMPEASAISAGPLALALSMIKDPREAAQSSFGVAVKISNGVMHVGEGLWSAGLDTLEKLGAVPRGTADDFAKLTNEERKKFARDFTSVFGEGTGFRIAEGTGEVLPFMMFPSTALPAGVTSAVSRVAAGLGLGAASGAAQGWLGGVGSEDQISENMDDRDAARTQGAIVGGALGAPIGAVTEGATVLKNWIPNAIKKAYEANQGLYAEGVEVSKRTGVRYKLSQLLQDPEIDAFERAYRGNFSGERAARNIEFDQAEQAKSYFQSLLKPQDKEPGEAVAAAFAKVLGDDTTGLLGKRKLDAGRNFQAAETAGAEITLKNTLSTIDEMIAENTDVMTGPANHALANQLRNLKTRILERGEGKVRQLRLKTNEGGVTFLEEYLTGGGLVKPLQLQKALENAGRAAKGNGKIFDEEVHMAAERGPAKRLFSALNRDLDEAVDEGLKGASELRFARDEYAKSTAAITELEDSALGQIFGAQGGANLDDIENAVLRMSSRQIKSTIDVLEKVDPAMRERLQQFYLERTFAAASRRGQAGSADFIPAKMIDFRQPGGRTANEGPEDVFNALFPDGPMRQKVADGIRAAQFIMVNNNATGGQNVVRLRNLAYALTNMNKGAAASFATQMLTPKAIGSYVLDPASVEALKQLTKPLNYSQTLGALTVLSNRWLASNPNAGAQVPEGQDGEAYTQ